MHDESSRHRQEGAGGRGGNGGRGANARSGNRQPGASDGRRGPHAGASVSRAPRVGADDSPRRKESRPAQQTSAIEKAAGSTGGRRIPRPLGSGDDRTSRRRASGGARRGDRSGPRRESAPRERFEALDPVEKHPAPPEHVDLNRLDRDVRAELRSLSKLTADVVGRHLVAAGASLDDDPTTALAHARAARSRAARVAVVREAVGLAAYHAGEWAEALAELRTARRISGDARNLALMADCERALGRPAQAVRYLTDPDARRLDAETRVELLIVVAGARRDLGQPEAALAVLTRGGIDTARPRPGSARLWYAYADVLEALGRIDDAALWFAASAAVDPEGELDAADRAAALL